MHGRPGGIGYQMSVAHGHGNGFMPHQSLDAVYIFAITGQPACKGVPKTVKYDSPGPVILLDAVIKADRIRKCPERMGQACAHVAPHYGRKDQSRSQFFFLLLSAFLKNTQGRIVQRYLASRLAVRLIAHGEHGMNHIHIRPFQPLKLTKPQSSVQRKDNAVMQVYVGQLFGRVYQRFYFLGRQEPFAGILNRRNFDATDRILSCENSYAFQLREASLGERVIYDAAVLLDGRRGRPGFDQAVDDALNIFPRDGRQGLCTNGRFDDFIEALFVREPAPLGAFGFGHVVPFKKVLEGHAGDILFRGLFFGGSAFGSRLLPHFRKALRPGTGLFVFLDPGQNLMSLFCVPLLSGPSHPFFDGAAIFFIANGVVAVGLPVALLTGRVLVVTDSGVRCLDFWLFHAPTMPPLLGEIKGTQGNLTIVYPTEITTPRKSGELRNQIQGLVKVPSWEFESPLRHHFFKPLQ